MAILKETVKLVELLMKKDNPYLKGKHCVEQDLLFCIAIWISLSIYVIELQSWPIGFGTLSIFYKFCCEITQLPIV